MNWWSLGEGSGYRGTELQLHRITCPFCMESGHFEFAYRAEKRKPNGRKALHFDTLKCVNCSGYVMVLWSASEASFSGFHDYKVLPWPTRLLKAPEGWPEAVGRYWLQAHRSLTDENWDAATVMARSALQLALREQGASGGSLKQEIEDLAAKGLLPPLMKEWSHEVRELGNDSAHPRPAQDPTAAEEAKDVVSFLDFALQYLYDLPQAIAQHRARREKRSNEE